MKTNIAFLGPSIALPDLINVTYSTFNVYKLLPKTWEKKFLEIRRLLDSGKINGIVIYLPTPFLLEASKVQYASLFLELIDSLKKTKSIIIIYEENLYGNFRFYNYVTEEYVDEQDLIRDLSNEIRENPIPYVDITGMNDKEIVELYNHHGYFFSQENSVKNLALNRMMDFENRSQEVLAFLDNILLSDIDVIPFKSKYEIKTVIQNYIFNAIENVVFSIYIEKDQPLIEEFETFLRLFEKYIKKIENIDVIIETEHLGGGINIKFKSKDSSNDFNYFQHCIDRFSQFMDLCVNDIDDAIEVVVKKVGNRNDAINIINDFTKKYRRLITDIQHEKEKILLSAKQDLESRIYEIEEKNYLNRYNVKEIAYDIIQNKQKIGSYTTNEYSSEEYKILEIIEKYSDSEKFLQVKSSIDKLKDREVSSEIKQNAATTIKGHLVKAGKKALTHAEDIGIKILTIYLESLVK